MYQLQAYANLLHNGHPALNSFDRERNEANRRTGFGWLLLIMAPSAFAFEQHSCTGQPLTETRDVSLLPNKVKSSLNLAKGHRRFVVAGLNTNCALVELELGGSEHSAELLVFEFISDKWQITQLQDIGHKVLSLRDLVVNQKNAAPHLKIAEVLSIASAELKRQSIDVSRMTPQIPVYDQEQREWFVFYIQTTPPLVIDGDVSVQVNDVTKKACAGRTLLPCVPGHTGNQESLG